MQKQFKQHRILNITNQIFVKHINKSSVGLPIMTSLIHII